MERTRFIRGYLFYHLAAVALFAIAYALLAGMTYASFWRAVLVYGTTPAVLLLYTWRSYRFLQSFPATAATEKSLYAATGAILLLSGMVLFSVAGYYSGRPVTGMTDLTGTVIFTPEGETIGEGDAAARILSHGIPQASDSEVLAVVQDFMDTLGYCSDAPPQIRQSYGSTVLFGNEFGEHAEFSVDVRRKTVRGFWMRYGRNRQATTAEAAGEYASRTAQLFRLLGLPPAAAPVDWQTLPADAPERTIARDLDEIMQNSGERERNTDLVRRFAWQKIHQGIPYFFNQLIMDFDTAGRLVYFYDDWTEDTPVRMNVAVTAEQADATGRRFVAEHYTTPYYRRCEFRMVRIQQYIVQPVLGGTILGCRKGAYRLGWVVEYEVYHRETPQHREYHLIDAGTGEHLGAIRAPARLLLPVAD